MKHKNIAVFIPHAGCPQQCSFCAQHAITGQEAAPDAQEVRRMLRGAAEKLAGDQEAEIAFFGGSFTAIEPDYRTQLLAAAREICAEYKLGGIRISTRPDAISNGILEELCTYGVTAVELGAQSMDEEVLRLNRRGHTAADVVRASEWIRAKGLELGLQMMTGLYGDTAAGAWETARVLAALHPQTVRIYPTVVLKHTLLAQKLASGDYRPMELEETVELCAGLLEFFEGQGIRVIKLGLHASQDVEQAMLGGVYHPAFRELCEAKCYYRRALALLEQETKRENRVLLVHPKAASKLAGQHGANRKALEALGFTRLKIRTDASVPEKEVRILPPEHKGHSQHE